MPDATLIRRWGTGGKPVNESAVLRAVQRLLVKHGRSLKTHELTMYLKTADVHYGSSDYLVRLLRASGYVTKRGRASGWGKP